MEQKKSKEKKGRHFSSTSSSSSVETSLLIPQGRTDGVGGRGKWGKEEEDWRRPRDGRERRKGQVLPVGVEGGKIDWVGSLVCKSTGKERKERGEV